MLEVFVVKVEMTMVWLNMLKNPDLNISTENDRSPSGERDANTREPDLTKRVH